MALSGYVSKIAPQLKEKRNYKREHRPRNCEVRFRSAPQRLLIEAEIVFPDRIVSSETSFKRDSFIPAEWGRKLLLFMEIK